MGVLDLGAPTEERISLVEEQHRTRPNCCIEDTIEVRLRLRDPLGVHLGEVNAQDVLGKYRHEPRAVAGLWTNGEGTEWALTIMPDGSHWYADQLTCQRGADNVANCSGNSQGAFGPTSWTVNLHKIR